MDLLAHAALVLDDKQPQPRRMAALKRLEHTRAEHRREIAQLLVPGLHASPDLAGRVHLTLLVLARDLAVGRDTEGRFVASARPLADAEADGVVAAALPDVGRVVGLDELARLFGPEEPLPAFLSPPDRPAPPPYRPPAWVIEQRERAEARAARRERLLALGLDDDDLEDDPPPTRAAWVERLRAPIVATVAPDAARTLSIHARDAHVDVGTAHAGAWWADERAGDHVQARRWLLRLDRSASSPEDAAAVASAGVLRRERSFSVDDGAVEIALGDVRITPRIPSRRVAAFVEEEDGLVVGLALAWLSPFARKPRPQPQPQLDARARRR